MNPAASIVDALQAHLKLCEDLVGVLERESLALRPDSNASTFESYQRRKEILPQLEGSLAELKRQREGWQQLTPAEKRQHPRTAALIRANQDLIMKAIVLDRENEQALLRRGMVPAQHLPSPHRQRPHFVAEVYRRYHNP